MFCPKCGSKNPDDGKFCRSCGVDLGNVNAAMSGTLAPLADLGLTEDESGNKRPKTVDDVFGDAIKSIISGLGFLIVSCVLFATNVAGGRSWFWAFLFPAFTFLAKGISDYAKSRRMERNRQFVAQPTMNTLNSTPVSSLTPPQTNFVAPESRYKTGDLVPPSVTDGTTKLLERDLDQEGQTQALPKV